LAPADAIRQLSMAPFESLDFATIDHHRALRQGYPEVIYGEGKNPEQVVAITERLLEHGSSALVTRTDASTRQALCVAIRGRSRQRHGAHRARRDAAVLYETADRSSS
jgi:NCAIR mutase (PurE)-related protein